MPIIESIKVYRGEKVTLHMTMTPSTDITGWTFLFTVAKSRNMFPKLFQVAGIITSGPNGTYDIPLITGELNRTPDTYYYDIFRVLPSDRILNEGEFIIAPDATYPTS